MTTIAKDFAVKFGISVAAIALALSAYAPAAQAQTTDELQQMINDLLAQVAQLQGQVAAPATAPGVCPYTWTRDLSAGSTGADVMKLQQFLNADPDTRVSVSGAGSAGMETDYYGPATGAAVAKFQVKYRAEILSPLGLVNPTQYFGAGSRAQANDLCIADVPDTDDMDEDEDEEEEEEDEDEDEDDGELRGEASLDSFELDEGETSIEENDEDVVVGEITVEFADGDAEISRIDITLQGTNANAEPWEAFETVSLWVDGDKIAEEDASDEDEYLDEDEGELRFTGLDLIAREDDELEILVAVTVQDNLDDEELDDADNDGWVLEVSSMRFFDADGVATTENDPAGSDTAAFEIEEEGAGEELDVSLSSNNPDGTDIVVDTDNDTNGVTVMVADLEADENDMELDRVVVLIETTGASTTAVIDEVYVVIDGEEFDAESVESAFSGTAPSTLTSRFDNADELGVWYVFDIDGDVVIDEDDEVEMEVVVDFNDTDDGARYSNGETVKASVTSSEFTYWRVDGAEDVTPGGSAVGDEHTLVAEGILVPSDGFTSDVETLGTNDTTGEFTLEFEVTAVEDDFYITETVASTTGTDGVRYGFTGAVGSGTVTGTLTSTADEDTAGIFTVREGETETFTLTVSIDPQATGVFRVSLTEIYYSADTDGVVDGVGGTDGTYTPLPVSDFRSSSQTING